MDIPSGLEADTGRVNGECIRAAVTVTMGMPKIGLYLNPGSDYTGEVVVGDISFPPQLKGEAGGGFICLIRGWWQVHCPAACLFSIKVILAMLW